MANYTTTVKSIIESGYDIDLKRYPIWEESYRETLNNAILKHYWFREIGFETAGLFKFHLNRVMAEIMPYYNRLYATTQYEFDPLHNYNIKEIFSEDTSADKNNTETLNLTDTSTVQSHKTDAATTHNESIYSDTPNGALPEGAIARGQYATNATIGSGNSNVTTDGNSTSTATNTGTRANAGKDIGTRDYTKTITGNQYHNMAELIIDWRKAIINITREIVLHPAIDELFMRIY